MDLEVDNDEYRTLGMVVIECRVRNDEVKLKRQMQDACVWKQMHEMSVKFVDACKMT